MCDEEDAQEEPQLISEMGINHFTNATLSVAMSPCPETSYSIVYVGGG